MNMTYNTVLRDILKGKIGSGYRVTQGNGLGNSPVKLERMFIPLLGICHQVCSYKIVQIVYIYLSKYFTGN